MHEVVLGELPPDSERLPLTAGGEVVVHDPEVERDVVANEVTPIMGEDELAQAVGVDQAGLVPRAGRGERQLRNRVRDDDVGLRVKPENAVEELPVPEGDGVTPIPFNEA